MAMGPPPKPAGTRQRRNTTASVTTLPVGGRNGTTPPWPLSPDAGALAVAVMVDAKAEDLRHKLSECDDRRSRPRLQRELDAALQKATAIRAQVDEQRALELSLWSTLWSTPHADAWEPLGWTRDVAQYVRHKVRGEAGSLDDAKEARQWSDRLGLNPLAMLRLRWEMQRLDEVEDRARRRRAAPRPQPVKKTSKRADARLALLK